MGLNIATHRNILLRVLKDIYSDPVLGPVLGFKGGTAAYIFYGLSRFSVDLDFDLLDAQHEDLVFERTKQILAAHGTIKDAAKKRFNLLFILSYTDKMTGAQNVKVEINRRPQGSQYEIKTYLGISMKVMVCEDMVANKLVALLERMGKTHRDIYDVWFFLQHHWPIHKEIVETRTGLSFKIFLERCVEALKKMSDRNILSGVGELLDAKQKIWAKAHLRQETIFLLKLLIETL